ncbi:putative dienelactone hydrolase [Planctomycetales bacterium 10988]|nr:putative dienelactone hydrolase [Planctomycetales bacterium 10988]
MITMNQTKVVLFGAFLGFLLVFSNENLVHALESEEVKVLNLEPKDAKRDRIVPLRIYFTEKETPQPVVLFSHGLGGSRENNGYLGNYWAEGGFIAVFMQHAGSDSEVWKNVPLTQIMSAMKKAANYQSFQSRIGDVSFVIDQLEAWNREPGHPLYGKLDLEHLGMSGHSYGSVTTLSVTERRFPFNQSLAEPRIDAFIAFSPQPGQRLSPERAFGEVRQPILCMTGTEDGNVIDPRVTPELRREVYKALPPGDKYELCFDGGTHAAFSDAGRRGVRRDPNHHPTIQKISLQFWKAYLQEDAEAKQWLQSKQPNDDCNLKPADVWQWK